MQTIQFLETAKWILNQFSPQTQELIFSNQIYQYLHGPNPDSARKILPAALRATHEIAVVQGRLITHPFAPQVLTAFKLTQLLDADFPVSLAEALTVSYTEKSIDELRDLIQPTVAGWHLLRRSIEPIEKLMIPEVIAEEKDFDEILTLELRYDHRNNPQANAVSELLLNATKLYEAVAIASGNREFEPLLVVYVTSGSSIRFDLKGLGEPIKQVKSLFVEVWRNIRHRRADDFHHNGKAILEGLDVLSKIETHKRNNVLDAEEAVRLKQQVTKSLLGLLEVGALPREIHDTELVPNKDLMQGMQQKLLPSAPQSQLKTGSKKTLAPKKASPKRTRKPSQNGQH